MSKELETARALVKMLEERQNESGATENRVQLSSLNPGDVIETSFGELIVLKHIGAATKVIAKGFVKERQKFDCDSPDFKTSEIEKFLSGGILEMFEKEFGSENILEETTTLTTVDMQEDYGTYTGKMRVITFDESREFNEVLVNEELPGPYWTMTPWSTKKRGWNFSLAVVSPSACIIILGCDRNLGVRPVCILKSNIFVSGVAKEIE